MCHVISRTCAVAMTMISPHHLAHNLMQDHTPPMSPGDKWTPDNPRALPVYFPPQLGQTVRHCCLPLASPEEVHLAVSHVWAAVKVYSLCTVMHKLLRGAGTGDGGRGGGGGWKEREGREREKERERQRHREGERASEHLRVCISVLWMCV